MGRSRRPGPGVGTLHRRRKRRWRLTAAAAIPVIAGCLLIVVMPSLAVVRPPIAAARSAPDRGLTKATALRVRTGRTYTVTLANKSSQRWLSVYDPYDPSEGCYTGCPVRPGGESASALVGATVQSRGGACVARVLVQGPIVNADTGNTAERRLARGLVPSGTTFAADAVPTMSGRVYLELSPDRSLRCHDARYAVRLTVQRALATDSAFIAGSASAAQYGSVSTALELKQAICDHKAQALNRYTNGLNAEIAADEHRRGLGRTIATLRAEVNTAVRKFFAACPQR